MTRLYFDDPDGDVLSRDTSHPKFVTHLTEEFYYDCTDEFSPFGNDDGADTLAALEDWYRDKKTVKKPMPFLKELIEGWDFDTDHIGLTDKDEILLVHGENEFLFDAIDDTVIATAFGQYKIEGRLNNDLRALADIAIDRQLIITQHAIDHSVTDARKLIKLVDGITTIPGEHDNMNGVLYMYVARLNKMKSDLQLLV